MRKPSLCLRHLLIYITDFLTWAKYFDMEETNLLNGHLFNVIGVSMSKNSSAGSQLSLNSAFNF